MDKTKSKDNISSQIGMAVNQIELAKQKFDKRFADEAVEDDLIIGLDFLVMVIRLYRNYRKDTMANA
ncbi:MAG: hypothetical protein ACE5KA_07465 [Nitrososphaerales archaeon]